MRISRKIGLAAVLVALPILLLSVWLAYKLIDYEQKLFISTANANFLLVKERLEGALANTSTGFDQHQAKQLHHSFLEQLQTDGDIISLLDRCKRQPEHTCFFLDDDRIIRQSSDHQTVGDHFDLKYFGKIYAEVMQSWNLNEIKTVINYRDLFHSDLHVFTASKIAGGYFVVGHQVPVLKEFWNYLQLFQHQQPLLDNIDFYVYVKQKLIHTRLLNSEQASNPIAVPENFMKKLSEILVQQPSYRYDPEKRELTYYGMLDIPLALPEERTVLVCSFHPPEFMAVGLRLKETFAGIILLFLLLFAVFYLYISKKYVIPLQLMENAFRSKTPITASELLGRRDEFRILGDTYNDMLEKLHQEIAYRNEMLERNEEIVRIVTHELGTPVSTVNIAQDMMTNNASPQDDAIKILGSASKQLSRVHDNLVYMLRFERGHFPQSELDLLQEVREVITTNTPLAERSSKYIVFEDASTETMSIRCNPVELAIILDNTLGNAIKYALPESEIYITLATHEKEYELSFSNKTAKSIKECQQLFEPHVRLENESKTPGLGIGLFIVKNVCDKNGIPIRCHYDEAQKTLTICYHFSKETSEI